MNLIGIAGKACAGKDTAAAILTAEFGFIRVALADPLKRACAEWFDWPEEQLWGPSELRNEPDMTRGGLTPRKALQLLGTEWGRRCWENVWVDIVISTARYVLAGQGSYDPVCGILGDYDPLVVPHMRPRGVAIPDVRFQNEVDAIHAAGGKVWLIDRPGAGLTGEAGAHSSEVLPTGFDAIIRNERGLEDFKTDVALVAQMYGLETVSQ